MLLAREALRHAAPAGPHALSIGVFDGVHRGHQSLIRRMTAEAEARGLTGGVVTFHPNPLAVVRPGQPFVYLTSLEQRVELLRALPGVEFVVVLEFTSDLAQVSAEDFARLLAEEAGLRLLVVGEDFALGRGREGDVARLTELGRELDFEVAPVALVADDEAHVSSTRTRAALAGGDMEQVARLLGRPFTLRGPVLHGDERGRTIGFPTLNIGVSPDRALPPNGVYATRAEVRGRRLAGCTNIGVRPTFDGGSRQVETYLLDFEGDLYDQLVTVELVHRLRDEQKFSGVEALVEQIGRDVAQTRAYFQ